jgi:hypothetical protein
MERFARIIVGYHGCRAQFAEELLLGRVAIREWQRSQNVYDWLGEGVYFWEHSPWRALRWSREKHGDQAGVIGAVIQLGECFDLLDERIAELLGQSFVAFKEAYELRGEELPKNRGREKKLRELDCAVINDCLRRLQEQGLRVDTVRGAFLEGEPIFEGTTISAETHLQIAVRNIDCILGVFRPNLE